MTEKREAFRIVALITTPKLADKATEVLLNEGIPIENRLHAVGTAPNKIMDILGLGSIDKIVIFSVMPKNLSRQVLKKLAKVLMLGMANSGIAFSLPLSGTSGAYVKMFDEGDYPEIRKDGSTVSDEKYSMIAVNVNRGYSNQVMDAAREAGASGGNVITSRRIANEAVTAKWGLGNQEEKEIVLIVAKDESKVDIMKKITEKCGISTEAKAMVFSMPIDQVEGL